MEPYIFEHFTFKTCEKKIVYVMQHTQRATPSKRIQYKEKVKRGHMNIKQSKNAKHERHTRP